jgi:hypothetical protein
VEEIEVKLQKGNRRLCQRGGLVSGSEGRYRNGRTNKVTRRWRKYVPKAVPWLRLLVAGLSQRRPSFVSRRVLIVFIVDNVELGQGFLPEFFSTPLSISYYRGSK